MLDPQFKSLQVVKNLVGHGDAIRLAFKYELKTIISLSMTCFVTLNPNVETWTYIGCGDGLKMKVTCLRLEHPLRSLLRCLSLESYMCSKGYPYPLLHVKILLLSGATNDHEG